LLLTVLIGCPGGGGGGGSQQSPSTVAVVTTDPVIQSIPPHSAQVGKQLQYQLDVASAVPATVVFTITTPLAGLSINPKTGLLTWVPVLVQTGDQLVTVAVTDGRGQTSQSFIVTVFATNPVASALIPKATGGIITVNDANSTINGLTLSIPPAALPSDLTITISELILPVLGGAHGQGFIKGFTIDPDGTQLSAPATVTIPYTLAQWPPNSGIPMESSLGAFFLDPTTGFPKYLQDFIIDITNHSVTGTLPHFSGYILTQLFRLCPPIGNSSEGDCPTAGVPVSASGPVPAVLVHGFQLGGFGDESTWGNLRSLLKERGPSSPQGISAWRFDWNAESVPFEKSAAGLAVAIKQVLLVAQASKVNLIAHSFGGILVRTYLQSQAVGVPYQGNVGRVMTLGTPHSGVGRNLSNFWAGGCSVFSSEDSFTTCFEMNVGQGGEAGAFLKRLNSLALPPLGSSDNPTAPDYYVIVGNEYDDSMTLQQSDGLITLAGQNICSMSGNPCQNSQKLKVEVISGLCHTHVPGGFVYNCPGKTSQNSFEAAIGDTSHPLWHRIYTFLAPAPLPVNPPPPTELGLGCSGFLYDDLGRPIALTAQIMLLQAATYYPFDVGCDGCLPPFPIYTVDYTTAGVDSTTTSGTATFDYSCLLLGTRCSKANVQVTVPVASQFIVESKQVTITLSNPHAGVYDMWGFSLPPPTRCPGP
jgi:hypothetical protein